MSRNYFFLISFLLVLTVSTACQVPLPPTHVPSINPTDTLTNPIPTQKASDSAESSQPLPSTRVIISPETAANLIYYQPLLGLPQWPDRLLWANPSVTPGNPSPPPDLLLQNEANLYPVFFNPPGLGDAIPLPLNGNQILTFAPDASSLAVQNPNRAGVYNIQGQELWLISKPEQPYSATYSSDSRFLGITSPLDIAVTIYDADSGQEIATLKGFSTAAPIYNVLVAPGGEIVAWYARATLQFQSVTDGQLSGEVHFEDFITSILYTPSGDHLIVSAAGKLMVYNSANAELLAKLTLSEPLHSIDISPDGKMLAGIYGDKLQFWDASTLTPVAALQTPGNLNQVAFSPDSRYLVTASDEQQLVIWYVP